jgi:hypothetical protein
VGLRVRGRGGRGGERRQAALPVEDLSDLQVPFRGPKGAERERERDGAGVEPGALGGMGCFSRGVY